MTDLMFHATLLSSCKICWKAYTRKPNMHASEVHCSRLNDYRSLKFQIEDPKSSRKLLQMTGNTYKIPDGAFLILRCQKTDFETNKVFIAQSKSDGVCISGNRRRHPKMGVQTRTSICIPFLSIIYTWRQRHGGRRPIWKHLLNLH